MKYVNLGCGGRFIENWLNFDFKSNSPFVTEVNLTKGIPLKSGEIDFVYHSHVLEHFSKFEGEKFLKECYRVLKEGGIIRIVVPDLEQIAINYLNNLKTAREDNSILNRESYYWSLIELLDQSVREEPGGEMLKIWSQQKIINEQQIIERSGEEFLRIRSHIKNNSSMNREVKRNITFKDKIKNILYKKLNIQVENLKVGNFRNSGEIHKWMYDSYSLKELLENIGFREVKIVDGFKSGLENWDDFKFLDIENGKIRKPDSIFIEAYR